jgi:hypothetical protein
MRKVCFLLVGLMLVLCVAAPCEATQWSQAFRTDDEPNLVNLWISAGSSFSSAALPSGWTYWQSDDGSWAQWFTHGGYGTVNIQGTQTFGSEKTAPFYLDVQEVHYDWTTRQVVAGYDYALYWSGTCWSLLDSSTDFSNSTDAVRDCPGPAVPEPATMLLLGSGLVGLAGFARKKLFKK